MRKQLVIMVNFINHTSGSHLVQILRRNRKTALDVLPKKKKDLTEQEEIRSVERVEETEETMSIDFNNNHKNK
jgi:hypothetical protein